MSSLHIFQTSPSRLQQSSYPKHSAASQGELMIVAMYRQSFMLGTHTLGGLVRSCLDYKLRNVRES